RARRWTGTSAYLPPQVEQHSLDKTPPGRPLRAAPERRQRIRELRFDVHRRRHRYGFLPGVRRLETVTASLSGPPRYEHEPDPGACPGEIENLLREPDRGGRARRRLEIVEHDPDVLGASLAAHVHHVGDLVVGELTVRGDEHDLALAILDHLAEAAGELRHRHLLLVDEELAVLVEPDDELVVVHPLPLG